MTEKSKPAYDLHSVKREFSTVGKLKATGTAVRGALSLDFGREEMVAAIQSIEGGHFVKSMTSYRDHTVWQDVYHVPFEAGVLYIKFSKDDATGYKLLSFKDRDDG